MHTVDTRGSIICALQRNDLLSTLDAIHPDDLLPAEAAQTAGVTMQLKVQQVNLKLAFALRTVCLHLPVRT